MKCCLLAPRVCQLIVMRLRTVQCRSVHWSSMHWKSALYSQVHCSTLQCCTMWLNAVLHKGTQYFIVRCGACSSVHCCGVLCSRLLKIHKIGTSIISDQTSCVKPLINRGFKYIFPIQNGLLPLCHHILLKCIYFSPNLPPLTSINLNICQKFQPKNIHTQKKLHKQSHKSCSQCSRHLECLQCSAVPLSIIQS